MSRMESGTLQVYVGPIRWRGQGVKAGFDPMKGVGLNKLEPQTGQQKKLYYVNVAEGQ